MITPEESWKVADYAWGAVTALVGVVWKMNESANKTTRKHLDEKIAYVNKRVDDMDADTMHELTTQRGHIGKIYDKIEEGNRRAEVMHVELLKAIHVGLSGKQDK